MDIKEVYKVFGLTDKIINNTSNSQEIIQKQLDIFSKNITTIISGRRN